MATTEEVLKALEIVSQQALELTAKQLLTEVNDSIPIFRGDLRDSHGIKKIKGGVEIRSSLKYARFQYNSRDNKNDKGPLMHPVKGGKFTRMTEIAQPTNAKGGGGKGRYASAYRAARKGGLLTPKRAEWFRIQKGSPILRRLSVFYTRVLSRGLAKK